MSILGEDTSVIEREGHLARKIHFRQIGVETGRFGMKDHDDIIPLLHTLRRSTFFSRNHGFYHPRLLHFACCLVYLDVAFDEIAEFTRRFLRHPAFPTQKQRMGKVVPVHYAGVSYLQAYVKKGVGA